MPELYLDRDAHIDPFLSIASGDTSKDTLLNMLNGMAAIQLNNLLNVDTLARQTYTAEQIDFDGGSVIHTRNFPIISVSAITYGVDDTAYTQTESYRFSKNRLLLDGVIAKSTGYAAVKVTYVGGYITYSQNDAGGAYVGQGETMPEDLKMATLLLVAGYFNQKQNIGVKSYSIQGMNVTFRDKMESEMFEQIVNRYKKTVITAI